MITVKCDIYGKEIETTVMNEVDDTNVFNDYCVRYDEPNVYGYVLTKESFKQSDGKRVPLCIYNKEGINKLDTLIGFADLEVKDDGVYAHCFLNDTMTVDLIKELSFSAKRIKLQNKLVVDGDIFEVISKIKED